MMKKTKEKTIRMDIISSVVSMITITSLIIGGVGGYSNYRNSISVLEQTMTELADLSADSINKELDKYVSAATETGMDSRLSDSEISKEEKIAIIERREKLFGFQDGYIIDRNGICIEDMADHSSTDYFKEAMKGNAFISISENIVISAPILVNNDINGVVAFVLTHDFLNEIVSSISISENSFAYIIDSQGNTIADADTDKVKEGYNIEELADKDNTLKSLASIHTLMHTNERGFEEYTYQGKKRFMAYATIKGTDGWSLAISSLQKDFLNNTYRAIIINGIIAILIVIAAILTAIVVGDYIAKPIILVMKRIESLAQGDLKSEMPKVDAKNETAHLANAMTVLINELNRMIGDCDYLLSEMSNGNFMVESNEASSYVGDFSNLFVSINSIKSNLSSTILKINDSAEYVFSGASQVSIASQSLSQGATEQASATEELSATINDMVDQVKNTSERLQYANEIAMQTKTELSESSLQMVNMTNAMSEISSTSSEISKIIKTIEDIAFQTNILALNAAVEAARAGAAGKGFAVVADEVRNLATKSAEASKNTSVLLERTLQAIENGTNIANITAKSLENVSLNTTKTTDAINNIAKLAENQTEQIQQIAIGMDQISAVTQTNSATAEQSAAASTELNNQATLLKDLIDNFHI